MVDFASLHPPYGSHHPRLHPGLFRPAPVLPEPLARLGADVLQVRVPELDPADPAAGLPGNPQSAWKRELLVALQDVLTAFEALELAVPEATLRRTRSVTTRGLLALPLRARRAET